MKIILKKGSTQQDLEEGRPYKKSTLHIYRDDGTLDWEYINPGLLTHDLAHYAVESILDMKNGFYGIINQGASISDFELPKGQKGFLVHPDTIHLEALQSEHLVNLVQSEIYNTGTLDDFIQIMKDICAENELEFPARLNKSSLKEIRSLYSELALEFHSMDEGQELELNLQDWKP